jgi:hypothetical protein
MRDLNLNVRTTLTFLVCVLISLVGRHCDAQQSKLAIEMRSLNKMRSGGMASLDFDLMKHTPGILKGRLTVNLSSRRGGVLTYTGDELTLSQARTRTRIMLPDTEFENSSDSINMHVTFSTNGATIDLGSRFVRMATRNERLFRVLFATNDQRVDIEQSKAVASLEFQQFWMPSPFDHEGQNQLRAWRQNQRQGLRPNQQQKQRRKDQPAKFVPVKPNISPSAIFTTPEHTLVADMPSLPLWYCNYNMVVLFSDAFANMRKSQLTALESWVKAGGSLLIEPLGVLDDYQIEFLERIKSRNSNEKQVIALTPDGRISPPEDWDFENLYYDLGRIVLLYRPVESGNEDSFDPTDFEWRSKAVTFLWQFRQDQFFSIEKTAAWQWQSANALGGVQVHNHETQARMGRLLTVPIASGGSLFNRLMPNEVKIVPLSYIAMILVFYVLTIGPLDYYVLGLFKLRRYTWISFPTMTLAFTLFTVWLSNDFLSSAVERTYVSVVDVGDDGKIIRENRIELLYTGSTHDVTTSLRSSFFVPLSTSQFSQADQNYGIRNSPRMTISARPIMPRIAGRPPTSTEATQTMPQWTPQLNRVFTLKCRDEVAIKGVRAFNWKTQRNFHLPVDRNKASMAARKAFGDSAIITVYQGRNPIVDEVSEKFGRSQFLVDICVRQQGGGLFGIVSRIAPHGGNDFEDLTILDPSDKTEFLLVIAVEEEDGLRLYRKLYRTQ